MTQENENYLPLYESFQKKEALFNDESLNFGCNKK